MKSIPFLIILIFVSFMVMHSCSNDDSADIKIEFQFTNNGQAMNLNDQIMINGTNLSFEVAQYYVGGLAADLDNSLLDFGDEYFIAAAGKVINIDQSFDIGNSHSFSFFVGVDEVNNSQTETDFTNRTTDDPLGIQDPSMHWNWASGYKFFRLDGTADIDGDGTLETPIAYHIGTDNLFRSYSKSLTKTLVAGVNTYTISLELSDLFNGVDFQIESNWDTHTANNPELAKLLVDNMNNAFSVQ